MPQLDQDMGLQFIIMVYAILTVLYFVIVMYLIVSIFSDYLKKKWLLLRADVLLEELSKINLQDDENFLISSKKLVLKLKKFDLKYKGSLKLLFVNKNNIKLND